jgi:hypothetical protein
MHDRKLPFRLSTSNPCTEDWAEMHGTSRERRCDLCDKQVHNLAQMKAREIEALVTEAKGSLCARITRRSDGSLVTLKTWAKPSFAAGAVASLALASPAVAQTSSDAPAQAILTGTILTPDGTKPASGATIALRQQDVVVVTTIADAHGHFRIAAPPGNYQIRIKQNALFGDHIRDASLHAGEQSISPVRTHIDPYEDGQQFVTMGEVVSVVSYPASYAFRHPWRYLKVLGWEGMSHPPIVR